MISLVEYAGFQFRAAPGDVIRVPLIDAQPESEITLDRVLMTIDGEKTVIGAPVVEGVTVKARVLGHGKERKVLVVKKKRRKDYIRRNGHRQDYTKIQITAIGG